MSGARTGVNNKNIQINHQICRLLIFNVFIRKMDGWARHAGTKVDSDALVQTLMIDNDPMAR